jgi:two-component system, sensor histidine kinase and response regulator
MREPVILCVDDEISILDSLKAELRDSLGGNFIIETAEDGRDALEIIEELTNDGYDIPLVISDYIMPKMRGDELLIKVHQKYPKILKIMLTGQASTEGVTNAVNQANLYRFIAKPWDKDDIALTIKEAVKSYFREEELEIKRNQLIEANERLSKLDKAKNYFLGLLSHELNTPLIGIEGFAKILRQTSESEDHIECCDSIITSSNRLKRFAELALLITNLKTEKYNFQFQTESMNEIIFYGISSLKAKALSKDLEIIVGKIENDITLNFDPFLIQKVVEIILDNAIKFSPSKEKIFVDCFKTDKQVSLVIADNGTGFSEESLNSLFEFFSSDELYHHDEGCGLGLAVAKIIMDSHNGVIEAANKGNGGANVKLIFNV